jgi:hypothetical protein
MSVPRRSVHVSEAWDDKLRIYVKGKLYDEFGPEPDPAYVVGVATDIAKSEGLPLTLPKTLEEFRS